MTSDEMAKGDANRYVRSAPSGLTHLTCLILGAMVVLGPQQAMAQPAPEPPAEYRWTVMWAPLRGLLGLAEFTGEYKFHEQFGLVLIAGGGRRDVKFDVPGGRLTFPATELEGGAQARYYAIRRGGHALQLGAEFLYERIKFDDPMPAGVLIVAAGGGTLGPFLGYKLVTPVGFTFEAQLGARYLVMNPPLPEGADNFSQGSDWQVLLHLNVGWSF